MEMAEPCPPTDRVHPTMGGPAVEALSADLRRMGPDDRSPTARSMVLAFAGQWLGSRPRLIASGQFPLVGRRHPYSNSPDVLERVLTVVRIAAESGYTVER